MLILCSDVRSPVADHLHHCHRWYFRLKSQLSEEDEEDISLTLLTSEKAKEQPELARLKALTDLQRVQSGLLKVRCNRRNQALIPLQGDDPSNIFQSLFESAAVTSGKALKENVPLSYASVWELYGNSTLVSLYTQLQLHTGEHGSHDVVLAACKLAIHVRLMSK